jgi:hypothetical protein
MLDDITKEKIRFKTEMIKLLAGLFIATGGGVIALLVGEVNTGPEIIFVGMGIIIDMLSVIIIYNQISSTIKIIRHGNN